MPDTQSSAFGARNASAVLLRFAYTIAAPQSSHAGVLFDAGAVPVGTGAACGVVWFNSMDWDSDGKLGRCAASGARVFCCNGVPMQSSFCGAGVRVPFVCVCNEFGVCVRDEVLCAPIAWLAVQKKFVPAAWDEKHKNPITLWCFLLFRQWRE